MRKNNIFIGGFFLAGFLTAVLFLMIGCSGGNPKNGAGASRTNAGDNKVVEIREKMYAAQVSDVYTNSADYIGKTLKLEGIFMIGQPYPEAEPFCTVVRYAPGGCCGNDGMSGFQVKWVMDFADKYPDNNSWVEATGVLKTYENGPYSFLYMDLINLNVLEERGAEFVSQ